MREPDAHPAVFLWRVGAGDGRPAVDLGELQLKWRCRVVPSSLGARTGASGAARQPSCLRGGGASAQLAPVPGPDRPPAGRTAGQTANRYSGGTGATGRSEGRARTQLPWHGSLRGVQVRLWCRCLPISPARAGQYGPIPLPPRCHEGQRPDRLPAIRPL